MSRTASQSTPWIERITAVNEPGLRESGNSTAAGFTLIELLAVIFILGLVAAVVAPVISSPKNTLRKEAGIMAGALRSLTESSEARKVETSMGFDFANSTASWQPPSGAPQRVEFETLKGVELVSKGLVREGQLWVFWIPSGLNEHMKVIFEEDGRRLEVLYNPVSGKTSLHGPSDESGK